MNNFSIEGLGNLSNDSRPLRSNQTRRDDSPKKKVGSDSFSSAASEYMQAIESEKGRLLGSSFVREADVDAAKRDLEDGSLTDRESLEDAADRLLQGDDAEFGFLNEF